MNARKSLKSLFHPKSFAVVGASSNLHRLGGIPLRLTKGYGFPGPIYPINPGREEIAGLKCYPDIASLPDTPEFALICTPREDVLPALAQCAERGVKAAAVITSGFAETGPEGVVLQEKILEIRDASGMRVLGPNCMGVVHVRSKLMATFTISIRDDDPLIPGAVAIVTQSGAMGACMLTGFQESGAGISSLVSLGNEVDVDFAECVEYFLDDPHTRVICGYLESVRDGKRLKKAARRALELGKPIVLLKGGKTEEGARAARSHTAAITTASDVFDAFAAQYGVQVLGSMDEFIEIADFLARSKPIQGNGVGILSFSGGLGALAADLSTDAGLRLPVLGEETQEKLAAVLPDYAPKDNPVDLVSLMVSQPESQPFKTAGEAVASDENVDALLFLMGIYHHVADQIAEEVKALFKSSDIPVAFTWLTGPREQIQAFKETIRTRIRRLLAGDSRPGIPLIPQTRARGRLVSAPLEKPYTQGSGQTKHKAEPAHPPMVFCRPRPAPKSWISTGFRDHGKFWSIRRRKRSGRVRNFRLPSRSKSYRRASRTKRGRAA